MNRVIVLFFYFLWMCLLSVSEANAQSVIQLSDTIGNYNIQDNIEVLPDSLGTLKIEQVSSPEYTSKFQKGYDKFIWLTNTSLKAHWLKFVVKNESNHNRWLVRIRGNKVTLFDQQTNGSFKTYQMGDMIPMTDWYFKKAFANDYILPVPVEEGEQKIFYVQIETINWLTLLNSTVTSQNTYRNYNEKISIFPEINFINECRNQTTFDYVIIGGLLIMLCYHLIVTFVLRDKVYLYYVLYSFFLLLTLMFWKGTIDVLGLYETPLDDGDKLFPFVILSIHIFYTLFLINYLDLAKFNPRFNTFIIRYLWIIFTVAILPMIILMLTNKSIFEIYGLPLAGNNFLLNLVLWLVVIGLWHKNPLVKVFLLGDSFFIISFAIAPLSAFLAFFNIPPISTFFWGVDLIDIGVFFQQIIFAYSLALRIQLSNQEKVKAQAHAVKIQQDANQQLENKVQERTQQLHETNEDLERSNELINVKNVELAATLSTLRSTQAQLIQSEKLASLGELTAGIAHEIQNPLNFVNNFAEVSAEMLDEMHQELEKGDTTEAIAIATDLKTNLEKINHHGQRASSIVKGMLEHSRVSTGVKEPTDLNTLADEYLRLAYHGLRAKDNSFNAIMETHFDPDLPKIEVIPQDIGRVLLNLINNAFYAVQQRTVETLHATSLPYQPTVTISTKRLDNAIEIRVQDNGNGIPEAIRDKIFQPFFTTKPTGQGTGLGLSLAYDIVTKGHGGYLEVETKENEGTEFTIILPVKTL